MVRGSDSMSFAVAAALLRQGRWIAALSLVVTAAALAGALRRPSHWPMWTLALALGAVQVFCAMRVGVDAALFARLAGQSNLADLDDALIEYAGMPPFKAGRSAGSRIQGALRWLRAQGMLAAAQCALLASALATAG